MIPTRELDKLELSDPGEQNIRKPTPAVMVDTPATLACLVDILFSLEKSSGSIYMDLEGVRLSRHGSISLIQIFVPSYENAFIVDIHTLGKTAFDTVGSEGISLKNVLESDNINKVLFDVRNDSDALYALFGVRLANVVDVQLLELASREGDKHIVCGLAKCIEQEQPLPLRALEQWQSTKKEVTKMFDPKLGGTYEVFNARPLSQALIEYCVGDVVCLPLLSMIYQSRLDGHWLGKARVETEKRLEESRSPSYKHQGRQKCFGPRKWRFPPKERKKLAPKATALAPKKGQKPVVAGGSSAPKTEDKSAIIVAASAPKKGTKSAPTAGSSAPKRKEKSTPTVKALARKKGEKSTATVPAPVPKKGKKSTAIVAASAPQQKEKSAATVAAPATRVPALPANREVLARSTSHQDGLRVRHHSIAFLPEGSTKGKSKWSSISPYSNVSFRDVLGDNDQNWALCDAECGWCGHCGDGIIEFC